jgi:cell division protein FtsL
VTETTAPNSTVEKKVASVKGLTNLFQTKWINANLLFFLYLALLAVGYIAYGHWTDKTLRSINKTQNELKDLQYEYKTVKSEVMKLSEQNEVLKKAEPLGLHISNEVPKRLIAPVCKEDNKTN